MIDETEIFEGSENSLVMSQTYTREFQCNYDFVSYPFDTQVITKGTNNRLPSICNIAFSNHIYLQLFSLPELNWQIAIFSSCRESKINNHDDNLDIIMTQTRHNTKDR